MSEKPRILFKVISFLLCFLLVFEQSGFAQIAGQLDVSGYITQMRQSLAIDKYRPLHLRYLSYDNLNNNFKLLLDQGDQLKGLFSAGLPAGRQGTAPEREIEDTSKILLNYFFVGVSLPNDSFWVNLRPDSPDNIIDPILARTDVGKILLESDLQLKKDTAKFTSPETPEGKDYWGKIYKKASELLGSENITIPTLTRPWIVPDEIIIREADTNAYIYKATLKVMLEQDYLKSSATYNFQDERLKQLNDYSSQLIRELILPKLTKEINSSKRYAPLRQVYYSLIMAQWFKQKFYGKGGLYSWLIDRRDLSGLTSKETWSKDTYFKAYQKSFKDGEYNFKEPVSTPLGQSVRSYFSGGMAFTSKSMAPAFANGAIGAKADISVQLAESGKNVAARANGGTTESLGVQDVIAERVPETAVAERTVQGNSNPAPSAKSQATLRSETSIVKRFLASLLVLLGVSLNYLSPAKATVGSGALKDNTKIVTTTAVDPSLIIRTDQAGNARFGLRAESLAANLSAATKLFLGIVKGEIDLSKLGKEGITNKGALSIVFAPYAAEYKPFRDEIIAQGGVTILQEAFRQNKDFSGEFLGYLLVDSDKDDAQRIIAELLQDENLKSERAPRVFNTLTTFADEKQFQGVVAPVIVANQGVAKLLDLINDKDYPQANSALELLGQLVLFSPANLSLQDSDRAVKVIQGALYSDSELRIQAYKSLRAIVLMPRYKNVVREISEKRARVNVLPAQRLSKDIVLILVDNFEKENHGFSVASQLVSEVEGKVINLNDAKLLRRLAQEFRIVSSDDARLKCEVARALLSKHGIKLKFFGVGVPKGIGTEGDTLKDVIGANKDNTTIISMSEGDLVGEVLPGVFIHYQDPRKVNSIVTLDDLNAWPGGELLFVTAAGNKSTPRLYTHPIQDNVLTIGAAEKDGGEWKPSAYTEYGVDLSFCAQGLAPDKKLGTSFAAPDVSAMIAVLLAKDPGLSIKDALEILNKQAAPINSPLFQDGYLGRGVLQGNIDASQNKPFSESVDEAQAQPSVSGTERNDNTQINDAGIASDNKAGLTRAAHEAYHNQGGFSNVISHDIKTELEKKGIKIRIIYDLRGLPRIDLRDAVRQAGGRIVTSHGEIYIDEATNILVIIDSRFQRDHAGRDQYAVYARNSVKAAHEMTELKSWAEWAQSAEAKRLGLQVTAEDIAAGRLGRILFAWMNEAGQQEARRKIIEAKVNEFHLLGLEAEYALQSKGKNVSVYLPDKFNIGAGYSDDRRLMSAVFALLPDNVHNILVGRTNQLIYPSGNKTGNGLNDNGKITLGTCLDPLYFIEAMMHEFGHHLDGDVRNHLGSQIDASELPHEYTQGLLLYLLYPEQFRKIASEDEIWNQVYEFYKKLFNGREYSRSDIGHIFTLIRINREKHKHDLDRAPFLQRVAQAQRQGYMDRVWDDWDKIRPAEGDDWIYADGFGSSEGSELDFIIASDGVQDVAVGEKVYDHDGYEGIVAKIELAGKEPGDKDNIVIEFNRAPNRETVYRKDLRRFYRSSLPKEQSQETKQKKLVQQVNEASFFSVRRIAEIEPELRDIVENLRTLGDKYGVQGFEKERADAIGVEDLWDEGEVTSREVWQEYLELVLRAIDLGCLREGVFTGHIDGELLASPLSELYTYLSTRQAPDKFISALAHVTAVLHLQGTRYPEAGDVSALSEFIQDAQARFDKVDRFYSKKIGYSLSGKFWLDDHYQMAADLSLYEGMIPYLEKMLGGLPSSVVKRMLDDNLDSPETTLGFCFFLTAVDVGDLYQNIGEYQRIMGEPIPYSMMVSFHDSTLYEYSDRIVDVLRDKIANPGVEELSEYLKAPEQLIFQAAFADAKQVWEYLKVKHSELYSDDDAWEGGRYLFIDDVPADLAERVLSKEGKARAATAISARYGLRAENARRITEAIGEFVAGNIEANSKSFRAIDNLDALLRMKEFPLNDVTQALLVAAAEQGKNDTGQIYSVIQAFAMRGMLYPEALYALVKSLKGKTITVVFKKFEDRGDLLEKLNADHQLENHLSFYAFIASRYGNASGLIICGLLDGIEKEIVPRVITEEQQRDIVEFCDQMNSFSPVFYRAFKSVSDRPAFVTTLKESADKVRTNTFGRKDIDALFKLVEGSSADEKEKVELLLAVYFTVIPPRDTSFLSWDDAVKLVLQTVGDTETGDPKQSLPAKIANYVRPAVPVASVRRSKKDAGIDYSSAMRDWMKRLQSKKDKEKGPTEEELSQGMLAYSKGEINDAQLREQFEAYLRQHAAFQEQLRAIISEQDYYTQAQKLSTLISDTLKHYLEPLQKRFAQTAQPVVAQALTNKKGLLKQLTQAPPQALPRILSGIATMGLQELQEDLSGIADAARRAMVAETITQVLAGRTDVDASRVKRVDILQAIWKENLSQLEQELDNIVVEREGKSSITFRVVKGYPYVVWGVNCGVCVAKDYELWKDPFFFLLSIVDDETGLVEGFVHLYDYEMSDGKRILLLPGINPTSELLSRVDPAELLDEIINTVQEIAQKAGYGAVYVPANEFIYSNHHPIKRAIKAKNYQSFPLGESIEWQKQHPVSEVFDISAHPARFKDTRPPLNADQIEQILSGRYGNLRGLEEHAKQLAKSKPTNPDRVFELYAQLLLDNPGAADASFEGGVTLSPEELVQYTASFDQTWQQAEGNPLAITQEQLEVLGGKDMGDSFVIKSDPNETIQEAIAKGERPTFRLECRLVKGKDDLSTVFNGAGKHVLRLNDRILIVEDYWNGLTELQRLNVLMHEAMAELMEWDHQPAEDLPMAVEGLSKEYDGTIGGKLSNHADQVRQDAHQSDIDRAMEGNKVTVDSRSLRALSSEESAACDRIFEKFASLQRFVAQESGKQYIRAKLFREEFMRQFMPRAATFGDGELVRDGAIKDFFVRFFSSDDDKDAFVRKVTRLVEMYRKYDALITEANHRINNNTDLSGTQFTKIVFLFEGSNPMRNFDYRNPLDMTLGLNIEYLMNPSNDGFGIGDIVHEAGHGLARQVKRPTIKGLEEDEELIANWFVAMLCTPEEVGNFLQSQTRTRSNIKSISGISATVHTVSQLTVVARKTGISESVLTELGNGSGPLCDSYGRYWDELTRLNPQVFKGRNTAQPRADSDVVGTPLNAIQIEEILQSRYGDRPGLAEYAEQLVKRNTATTREEALAAYADYARSNPGAFAKWGWQKKQFTAGRQLSTGAQALSQEFQAIMQDKIKEAHQPVADRYQDAIKSLKVTKIELLDDGPDGGKIYRVLSENGDKFLVFTNNDDRVLGLAIRLPAEDKAQPGQAGVEESYTVINADEHLCALFEDEFRPELHPVFNQRNPLGDPDFQAVEDKRAEFGSVKVGRQSGTKIFMPILNNVYYLLEQMENDYINNAIVRHLVKRLGARAADALSGSVHLSQFEHNRPDKYWDGRVHYDINSQNAMYASLIGRTDSIVHELAHELYLTLSDAERATLREYYNGKGELIRLMKLHYTEYAADDDIALRDMLVAEAIAHSVEALSEGRDAVIIKDVHQNFHQASIISEDKDILQQHGFLPISQSSTPMISKEVGGIDLSTMPIVAQQVSLQGQARNFQTLGQSLSGTAPVDLIREWREIEKMLAANITPSTQRIKEYLQACCSSGCIDKERDKVLGCIADVLRMEEERCSATDAALKEILTTLEQGSPDSGLAIILSKINVLPGQPVSIP